MPKTKSLNASCATLALSFPALALGLFLVSVKQSTEAEGCPIAFDLNGNGYIDITGHTSTQEKVYSLFSIENYVMFDIFGDGTPVEIDWIQGDADALLVDLSDGIPEGNLTGMHLFGTVGRAADGSQEFYDNGFQKLVLKDTDGDRILTGAELDGLALWRDNGDAQFDPSELVQLADLDIVSISTIAETTAGPYGSDVLASGATTADGRKIYTEDIWFMTSGEPLEEHRDIAQRLHRLGF